MYLAISKLVEVIARAAFTVGILFALPLNHAGQFGLVVTMVALAAFAFGWERHLDIQRRLVGSAPAVFDRAVSNMMRLWLINYVWMLPILALALLYWAALPLWLLLPVLAVALCEQQANAAYNLAVVEPRYRLLMIWPLSKNLLLLGATAAALLLWPNWLRIDRALLLWTVVSILATLPLALHWWRIRQQPAGTIAQPVPDGMWGQHRASLTHFLTGLLALFMLQFDRLMVGGLVPADQAGVYFRHVTLIGFAYQLFNVLSYNRQLPQIFALTRDIGIAPAQRVARRELALLTLLVVPTFAAVVALDDYFDQQLSQRYHLSAALLAILLSGAALRMIADFQALILNAKLLEQRVLANQTAAFFIMAALLVGLTVRFGIWGAAVAYAIGASLYLLLNVYAVLTLRRQAGEES